MTALSTLDGPVETPRSANQMSDLSEEQQLKKQEGIIRKAIADTENAALRAGQALLVIKEDKLFKPKYKSFSKYLKEEWPELNSKRTANRDIVFARVVRKIGTNWSLCVPQNEYQVRAMTRVEESVWPEVWEQVAEKVEAGEKLTGPLVESVVDLFDPDGAATKKSDKPQQLQDENGQDIDTPSVDEQPYQPGGSDDTEKEEARQSHAAAKDNRQQRPDDIEIAPSPTPDQSATTAPNVPADDISQDQILAQIRRLAEQLDEHHLAALSRELGAEAKDPLQSLRSQSPTDRQAILLRAYREFPEDFCAVEEAQKAEPLVLSYEFDPREIKMTPQMAASKEFREMWNEWCGHQEDLGSPLSPEVARFHFKMVGRKRIPTAIACLQGAIDIGEDTPLLRPLRQDRKETTHPVAANPPTVEEVAEYAESIDQRHFDAELFVDTYACKGWVIGPDKPMVDWRAAVRKAKTWCCEGRVKRKRRIPVAAGETRDF
ncbi:MAG TPA: hypothetical protein DDW52_06745 [Planctomycetaceae bacterium]|nr:hypothetical protein [Planctomycetaceae bacterium]